ncbi:MAG: polyprenyl synthetase family protein, partial [Spirochaetales bacterium]|nr:polyprenyl synthetase family protein [Spirochaetales bacterium]
ILDYAGGDIGKPVGVDLREGKITLPLLGALERVDRAEQTRIRDQVRDVSDHPEYIGEIMDFVKEHDGIGYAQERLLTLSACAKDSLAPLQDGPAKDFLAALAAFTVERKK